MISGDMQRPSLPDPECRFEIVSKVILRHVNLSTTQRYLGKTSDTEATRWIENLY
jgi:hypothetical protein